MLNVALMGSMVPTILKLHTYIFILLSTVQTDIGFYRIDHWTRYLVSKISLGRYLLENSNNIKACICWFI